MLCVGFSILSQLVKLMKIKFAQDLLCQPRQKAKLNLCLHTTEDAITTKIKIKTI